MSELRKTHDGDAAVHHYREFMRAIGIDLESPHAKDTPNRVTKMFLHDFGNHLKHIGRETNLTAFPDEGDQYIAIRNIPYGSLCSHHHLPHYGTVDIVYHPNGRILGLSKFPRIVRFEAGKPCTQEDLTVRIAETVMSAIQPKGVYVRVTGVHTCMVVRGVRSTGETITSAIRPTHEDMNVPEALELIR